jgi:hypothetical protein
VEATADVRVSNNLLTAGSLAGGPRGFETPAGSVSLTSSSGSELDLPFEGGSRVDGPAWEQARYTKRDADGTVDSRAPCSQSKLGRHGRFGTYRAVPSFTGGYSTPSRTLVSHGDRRELLLGHNYGTRDLGGTRLSGQVTEMIASFNVCVRLGRPCRVLKPS